MLKYCNSIFFQVTFIRMRYTRCKITSAVTQTSLKGNSSSFFFFKKMMSIKPWLKRLVPKHHDLFDLWQHHTHTWNRASVKTYRNLLISRTNSYSFDTAVRFYLPSLQMAPAGEENSIFKKFTFFEKSYYLQKGTW